MNMQNIMTNWKTSLGGVALIAAGALHAFGVDIPGFTMDLGTALTAGISLILAQDGKSA